MFDIAPTELMLVAVVALVVIGPKDLPRAMRFVGHWVAKGRGVMNQVRSGFDTMVREAELQEMEKKWAEENARIMREHADPVPSLPSSPADHASETVVEPVSEDAPPVMVEQPVVTPAAEPQLELEPGAPRPVAKTRKPRAKSAEPKAAS
ncbi:hypothetical protein ASG11_14080 [Sphingomonas sp. Leaf357]|uniref:Sec-independent protein translocase protein TatB n=1 Tax=Sphingomonas sp. Leaf357 TaxID=1736350 RepID=UPI000701423D|nr:Sec-independent protein translocase protein TatB [Sphingomonas sp. Leaf357]KQS01941.1 hypothetical protein ASG11_14080 [Sphingomonas sp. Leaf357]